MSRHGPWLQRVTTALDTFDIALDTQGSTDSETASLLIPASSSLPHTHR